MKLMTRVDLCSCRVHKELYLNCTEMPDTRRINLYIKCCNKVRIWCTLSLAERAQITFKICSSAPASAALLRARCSASPTRFYGLCFLKGTKWSNVILTKGRAAPTAFATYSICVTKQSLSTHKIGDSVGKRAILRTQSTFFIVNLKRRDIWIIFAWIYSNDKN